jgi:hypothetical protein
MFIEGIIDESYYDEIVQAGYDIIWVAKTPLQAQKHGYEFAGPPIGKVIVRIFLNSDIESVITPELLAKESARRKDLPLTMMSDNTEIRDAAVELLERSK